MVDPSLALRAGIPSPALATLRSSASLRSTSRTGRYGRRAVTFTETLITATLLGLLLVVVALGVHSVRSDLKHKQVWDLLVTLDKALDAYHETTGTWPFTLATQPDETEPERLSSNDDPTESGRRVINALAAVPASREILDTIPDLLRVPPESKQAEPNDWGTVRDAWGQPLHCLTALSRIPVEWQAVAANLGKPIFISAGTDGQFSSRDSVAEADNLRSDQLPR